MNRIYLSMLLALIYLSQPGYSQTRKGQGTTKGGGSGAQGKKYKVRWKTVPFDHQVFIANKGQFDAAIPGDNKVLFGAQLGNVWAYFTDKGIVYSYAERPEKDDKDAASDPDADGPVKPVMHYLACNWIGSNPAAVVEMEGKQGYPYIYTTEINKNIRTEIYKKITYKNIYPGIDIEYMFPNGKAGFKYSIIVHPGADISKVKLNYPSLGALHVWENGEITFGSEVGEITEQAPVAGYEGGELESTTVSYQTEGNTESFKLSESYDKSKTIIIDPWITDPLFTNPYDRAYDIDFDNRGNVYAYGSWSPLMAEKFNSNGAPQWVYNAIPFGSNSSYYGDIVVNRISGTTYLTEGFNGGGARVIKLNTNGVYLGISVQNSNLSEMWRAVYDPCNNNIILGAGGISAADQACILDTNMGSPTPVNILGAVDAYHDIALICPDPSGLFCYMATAQSLSHPTEFSDVVVQLPLPSLSPTVYITPDHFNFHEVTVPTYVGPGAGTANGYNGMAASPSWLYIYNSLTLKRLNKSTGALVDSIPINNTVLTNAEPQWGGLDVDPCDDIFVGVNDSIKVYNSTMVLDTSLVLGNTVYDVVLGQNDQLYASGQSFVCAVNVPPLASLISTVAGSPSSCSACNGTATVNINCGVAPFSFLWSDGSTNQVDTGLCAGVYRVKVTDGSCPPRFDSALISVGGKPGYTASVRDTNPGCINNLGNITVYPSGGTAPYTYSWTNGATTQEVTGLPAGTYTCVITDHDGCKYFSVSTLVNPIPPDITIYPAQDSICLGSSVNLTASGLKTYNWTPNTGLSCYICSNPIATPTATTTYTITAVDSNGCTATTTATIKVSTAPKPIITGKDSICLGYRDTLSVTGGNTYLWSNGATTTTISGIIGGTQTFTVTAYNGLCSHDTTFTVRVILSPTAAVAAIPDTVCVGDSTLLTASGGSSYLWDNGKTTSSIWVVPSTTTTYTLEAFAGTCNNSTTITVHINPATTATISKNDTICSKGNVILTTTGSGGPVTYKWSTGATTSAITVSPDSTTTYTSTVYGKCDSVRNTVTILVSPPPTPIITGTNWKCKGVKDTLKVSGGCTYAWKDGNTSTTYITGPINADSTFSIIVKNCFGCPIKDSFNVAVRAPETFSVTPAQVCSGDCIQLTTSLTSPSFSYKWSNGATTDTTTVCADSTSVYNVTISNGCPATKSVTVQVYPPSLYACCDTTILNGGSAQLSAISSTNYKWYPPTGLNCDTCSHVTATPTVTTTYTVTGTNSHGCKDQTVVTVIVDIPCFDFYVPNVFSPNGDGINETFEIQTKNLTGFSIYIYDRWGKEMFKTNNPDVWWNGLTEGGGQAPTGVYYYIIKATCQGNTYKKEGFLQLIR